VIKKIVLLALAISAPGAMTHAETSQPAQTPVSNDDILSALSLLIRAGVLKADPNSCQLDQALLDQLQQKCGVDGTVCAESGSVCVTK
jgi:hypothetical protein